MFTKDIIEYECILKPYQINENIEKIILEQTKLHLLNKCSGYGYIKQIIRIVKKLDGIITNDGNIIFKVYLEILNCNPQIGDEIDCKITDKDDRIGKPIMKKDPILAILFTDKNYEIGEKVSGIITDKRIDKTNNMINLLVQIS